MSKSKKIIIKATDYKYPTKKERMIVHKLEPLLSNFDFQYVHPLTAILNDISSISNVHKSANLYWWDHCLQNRIGSLSQAYLNCIVHFNRGVPDDIEVFEKENFVNRVQFDFYAETFYYFFSTTKDNIAQILNVYFALNIPENKIYLNKTFIDAIPNKNVSNEIKLFLNETSLTTEYRNGFTHRFPITHPDHRSKLQTLNGQPSYVFSSGVYIKTSDIVNNIIKSLKILSDFLINVKKELR